MSVNADRVEHIANAFAVELLLNDTYVNDNRDHSIYDLANIRGVPRQFIKLKHRPL